MSYLGWTDIEPQKTENKDQEVMLERNLSGRYESRFVSVKIEKSPSIMLSGMQESVLGVWVAHGEGELVVVCSSSVFNPEDGITIISDNINSKINNINNSNNKTINF